MEGDTPSLARGLDAILKLQNMSEQNSVLTENNIAYLSLQQLEPGKFQPRKNFSPDELRELAESIKTHGILQPLIVRPTDKNTYEIIAGERRWRAAHLAQLREIPVIIRHITDAIACAFSLVENIQRKNLNPVEEAEALQRLHHEFTMSHEEIAKSVGRSRVSVTNILRLLLLDEEIKQCLLKEIISMGHARALITLSPEQQKEVCGLIVRKGLSVRQTEELIRRMQAPSNHLPTADDYWNEQEIARYRNELRKYLMTDISIKTFNDGKCHVTFKANSREALEQLIERLQVIK